jgi:hypothetical protein
MHRRPSLEHREVEMSPQHLFWYLAILAFASYQDAASYLSSHVEKGQMSNALGSPQEEFKIGGSPHVEE